ncbi:hypothetical protein WICPIJ_006357 [Wickerhamomyces pijperi]|uniref:Peptidase A1 domain-containing protein n=1 Tax=Wickerhamomyces pijperi TaxID=599730 RepID=A0A9P8Q4L6_WICPI|nr:hypothetical protein WICPIJ_006357 [Wickerhamomyces pijperi]
MLPSNLFTSLLLLTSINAGGVSALKNHNERQDVPLLELNFEKRSKNQATLVKRSAYEEVDFESHISGFYLNITLGTPAQEVEVELNFADSELQVFKDTIPGCVENNPVSTTTQYQSYTKTIISVVSNTLTCEGRSFNTRKSSTYSDKITDIFGSDTKVSPWFKFNYGTSIVQGNYAMDTFSLNNVTFKDFIFLSTNQSTYQRSALGLAPTVLEYSNLVKNGTTYPNFLDRLVEDGYISQRIYSVYANDLRSNAGSIVFGGIDHSKYTGELITVPITKDDRYDNIDASAIFKLGLTIEGTGLETSEGNVSFSNYVATYYQFTPNDDMTWLPAPVFDNLMIQLKAQKNNITSNAPTPYSHYIDCPTNEEAFSTKLAFNIGGTLFKVPIYNFINYKDDENRCYLGLDKGYSLNLGTLGSAFSRSFYSVVDLDDMQLSFAPMNFTGAVGAADSENNVEILSQGLTAINSAPLYSRSWTPEDDISSTINTDDVFTLSTVYEASATYSGDSQATFSFSVDPEMEDAYKGADIVSSFVSYTVGTKTLETAQSSSSTSAKKNDASPAVLGVESFQIRLSLGFMALTLALLLI